ncbi:DsbA family protein [Thioclava sp. BHET1]|uniref:Thiol-disulfide oxidoreductase n=1 Tax=Thioclava dalianensis TaxID=1185766 RepID=A0A074THQ7_9RHOB|nr:DsbA family protein [Thioclava dalianensis]KEP69685.1 thiol-disulfide oxidoreductase [Thioclava dalianensis]TMV94643.1 DsbA family protein [Thioclava sp. BHET1]SFM92788.1 Protein-disulfide isomerase [Thioclava dalianensis]
MSKTLTILGGLAVAGVLGAGGWYASQHSEASLITAAQAQEATADTKDVQTLPDVVLGQEDAPVTVIEYASFTCPHCAHWHETEFPTLKKDYIDTGKVKFIQREVYFDKFGIWAGLIAQCGGDPKYYAISNMLFDKQKEWIGDGKQQTIADNLRKIGLQAGLSQDQVNACMSDEKRAEQLVATYQKNASADKIDATPTFLIDGEKHANMAWDDFKKILDDELAKKAN